MVLVRAVDIAANETVGLRIDGRDVRFLASGFARLCVKCSRNPAFTGVRFPGDSLLTNIVGLKECTELVILFLSDRIVLVIMTASTLQSDSQKAGGHMFDRLLHPHVAIEKVPGEGEIACSSESVQVKRSDLITS